MTVKILNVNMVLIKSKTQLIANCTTFTFIYVSCQIQLAKEEETKKRVLNSSMTALIVMLHRNNIIIANAFDYYNHVNKP